MSSKTPLHLNNYLTFRLARVQAKLNAQGARLLKQVSGLSLAQWRIIAILGTDGETTSSELSRNAEFDKGLLSRKLKTLTDVGLVKSTPHPTDRRVQILSLTPRGHDIFEETLPHTRARQERLRSLLSSAELDALYSALDKLEAALESEAAE